MRMTIKISMQQKLIRCNKSKSKCNKNITHSNSNSKYHSISVFCFINFHNIFLFLNFGIVKKVEEIDVTSSENSGGLRLNWENWQNWRYVRTPWGLEVLCRFRIWHLFANTDNGIIGNQAGTWTEEEGLEVLLIVLKKILFLNF